MKSRTPEVLAAGQTVVLEGIVHASGTPVDKWVVVEHPTVSSLPGGVVVKCCLLTLSPEQSGCLPVVLTNEADHDVIIPRRCVIGEIHAMESVRLPNKSVSKTGLESIQSEICKESRITLDFGNSPLSQEWKERITKRLNEMPEVFAQHDLDFGWTQKVRHRIKLSDETPFKQKARPIHPQDLEAVRKHLQELLSSGVIRESESPFSSPIVVVKKKNRDVRLCIDYRKLNLQTIKDAYALPNLEETFVALNGSKWFSVLDLKSGYYQIEVEEADKPKTAFVCPLGFWEFNRMPQGVTNAPSTFQRLMERCMGDINLKEVLMFLDDIIVFSETLEEHERRLLQVLTRLKEYGLKLSPEKCRFFQTSVKYLGHIVSERGVETDPGKIETIKTWPCPKNLKELRSFLGFCGYYRRFIKDYSHIVKPLNELTSGYPPLRKGSKKPGKEGQYHNPKEPFGGRWTPSCQTAFETLITKLSTAPVLGFADPKLPYILHTDASTSGLGAALYQEQDEQQRVIAFASRGLSRSESRYPAHKLEFLALKWAVTEKCHDYLYGSSFTVVTDSNLLTYLLTTAKLDAVSYRWLAALSTFSFTLQYRAGKQNVDADSLSRRPHRELFDDQLSTKEIERIEKFVQYHTNDTNASSITDPGVVKAICEKHLVQQNNDPAYPLVMSLAIHPDAVPDCYVQDDVLIGSSAMSHLTKEELAEKQRSDPVIREVLTYLESGEKPPPVVRKEIPDIPFYLREWDRLEMKEGILYRRRQDGDSITYQLVLPEELRSFAVNQLHNQMGHMGIERTMDLVRSRFYWPRMGSEVEHRIKTCNRSVRRKALPQRAAPLVNIQASRPLELVCMDFLSLEPDKSNTRDILVITDFFTKYAVAIPTPNQKASTVAKSLWDQFIVHYGFPERLHSDQGPDFESRTIKELCAITGTQSSHDTLPPPREPSRAIQSHPTRYAGNPGGERKESLERICQTFSPCVQLY
ncbi:Retrovirus-related Pol polyprotein from transposon 412 [Labeo rohita]|uniref:Gypsy retrotransposon integrase-like protein 1 n=1 Tax=Labeo rohita TaxID=84645 RepID=A0A498NW03_LABRO|nr:Retrovirus-related Pol polyprotein from transposon 412 [Labeo rohita]